MANDIYTPDEDWRAGLVTKDEAMAWRREAWDGHEEFAAEEAVKEEAG